VKKRSLSLKEIDEAMRRCGMQEDNTCMLFGSKYCKDECPIGSDFEAEGGVLIASENATPEEE
jgi:hypothetical protein